jgi:hypothetical protein
VLLDAVMSCSVGAGSFKTWNSLGFVGK